MYARKFRNLMPFGCWWFLNNPSIVEEITRERIEMLGFSFIPQNSDARILEQLIYKWRNTRRTLAPILTKSYELLAANGRQITPADIQRDVTRLFRTNFSTGPGSPIEENGHVRWIICGLLFFATTVNYIDRQVLGILKPVLAKDLHWTESDYGWIVSAFQFAYALMMPIAGRIIDRLGTRLGYALAVIVWSAAAMAHSLASNWGQFVAARFGLGIGEAANFPPPSRP